MGRRRTGEPPRMLHHKATGRAYSTHPRTGKPVYFGKWGTEEAVTAYQRWLGELLSTTDAPALTPGREKKLTLSSLIEQYLTYCASYYRKPDGRPTSELGSMKQILIPLNTRFGSLLAAEFAPSHLLEMREQLVKDDLERVFINQQMARIKRMFAWGVERGLIPESVHGALLRVRTLPKGRGNVRERRKVKPIPADSVKQVLKHLAPMTRVMVQVHLLLGCRSSELCSMRAGEIDRTETPWVYRPASWKTAWRENEDQTEILIGPKARALLEPLLMGLEDGDWVFPSRVKDHLAAKGSPGHISYHGYRRAVVKACARAGVPRWTPRQIRHTRLTEVRKDYGIEAAQALGRHKEITTTQIYAQRLDALARQAAEETG